MNAQELSILPLLRENNRCLFRGSTIFLDQSEDLLQDSIIGNFRYFISSSVEKTSLSLEIGASYNPILPKSAGYNVRIVDHVDQLSLRSKYSQFSEEIKNGIEEVDYVWTEGPLSALAQDQVFSFVIASHVIEHFVDFLGFIQDCELFLHQEGQLILIVPDKRFCFDYFQPLSDVAKVLADHFRRSSRHSFETHYRQTMHAVAELQSGKIHFWGQEKIRSLSFLTGDPEAIYRQALENVTADEYRDGHNNFFTPASFLSLIEELRYLRLIGLRVDTITRSRGCEFLVIMKKDESDRPTLDEFLSRKRALLMHTMVEEKERLTFSPIS